MKGRKRTILSLEKLFGIFLILGIVINIRSFYHLELSNSQNPLLFGNEPELYTFPKRPPRSKPTRPPPKYDLDHPPPNEFSFEVVHTVQTRFMVGQPNQPTLARARFKLFETFCFPTMRYQTSQNYYWIVLADPRLDESVLTDMKHLLEPMPNAYLILTSNSTWAADGIGVPNVTTYGVDLQDIADEVRSNPKLVVATGNRTRLQQFNLLGRNSMSSSSATVLKLDTLLDADDGLHNQGIEWMQEMAVGYAKYQQSVLLPSVPLELASTWWIFCGTDHIEWHNREIYLLKPVEYEKNGISSGLTGLRKEPFFCVSAGLTRVGLMQSPIHSVTYPRLAYINHAEVSQRLPRCGENGTVSSCWKREFPNVPLIVKSRSVTSDSMDHLDPDKAD